MAEQPWMVEARKFLGVKEIAGPADDPRIIGFFKAAGHPQVQTELTPWCAAFVGANLEAAGIRSTRALNARSYLSWGKGISEPVPGCIVVFKRGNSEWQGHVAFYEKDGGNYVWVLGGNQSNAVTIAKYAKSNVLGYRMPDSTVERVPKPAPAVPMPSVEEVKELQRLLVKAGYSVGSAGVDGDLGDDTRGALRALLENRKMPAPPKLLDKAYVRGVIAMLDIPFIPTIARPQPGAGGAAGFPESETAGDPAKGSGGRVGLIAGLLVVLGATVAAGYFVGRSQGWW